MWRPMTEKDFPNLMEIVKEINDGYVIELEGFEDELVQPFDLHVEIETDDDTNYVRIVDYNEELTWDGMFTERTLEKLNAALKKDTDDNAYFDALDVAQWSADWEKGRSRYREENLEGEISIGVSRALINYIDDNGIEPKTWTYSQKKAFDDAKKQMVKVCMELINSWKEN